MDERHPEEEQVKLRRAFGAALRTLAARPDPPGAAELLATIPASDDPAVRAGWRGRIDALALRTRHSDAQMLASTAPAEAPRLALFEALEQGRVEALGATLAGVRANLAQFARVPLAHGAAVLQAARSRWGAPALPGEPVASIVVTESAARKIGAMADLLHDQWAFAMAALDLVAATFAEPQAPDGSAQDSAPQGRSPVSDARGEPSTGDAPNQRSAMHPDARDGFGGRGPGGETRTGAAREAAFAAMRSTEEADIGAQAAGGKARAAQHLAGGRATDSAASEDAPPYRVYTREFDRIIDHQERHCGAAAPFVHEDRHRSKMRQELERSRANFARWAHRLQRHLMVRQMRAWQFDTEEGLLDAARLTRIVTDPTLPLSFKQERPDEFPATAVTLLIDCSGSMRGPPIATAAGCAELLVTVLERCGIQAEILGFTTRRWRGGEARSKWLGAGRPRDPGRLTDLLHLVFKRGNTPWRRARRGFAGILDDELLKENIDGEALIWAHERMMRRAETRKILLVVSDGAPLDDATLAANDPGYLDRHLRQVIRHIDTRSPVELLAIGIGHNVGAYYPRSFTVTGAENLGEALVTQLIALLDAPRRRGAAVRRPARASASAVR